MKKVDNHIAIIPKEVNTDEDRDNEECEKFHADKDNERYHERKDEEA